MDAIHLPNGDVTIAEGSWLLLRWFRKTNKVVVITDNAPADMMHRAWELLATIRGDAPE